MLLFVLIILGNNLTFTSLVDRHGAPEGSSERPSKRNCSQRSPIERWLTKCGGRKKAFALNPGSPKITIPFQGS
jgi:hypothetical protein